MTKKTKQTRRQRINERLEFIENGDHFDRKKFVKDVKAEFAKLDTQIERLKEKKR